MHTPTQRLQQIVTQNRLKLRGGTFGGMQVMTAGLRPETFKRKAAEELICLRENRSVLRMWGKPFSGAAAIKLARVRACIAKAGALAAEDRQSAAEISFPLAAE